MDDLVTASWLAENLGAPDLVILESTKYLPNEGKDGHAAFLAAHISGARYFDPRPYRPTSTVRCPTWCRRRVGSPAWLARSGSGTTAGSCSMTRTRPLWATPGVVDDGAVRPTTTPPCWMVAWQRGVARATRPKPASPTLRQPGRSPPGCAPNGCAACRTCWTRRRWCWMPAGRRDSPDPSPEPRPGVTPGHHAGRGQPALQRPARPGWPLPAARRIARPGCWQPAWTGSRPRDHHLAAAGVSATVLTMALKRAGFPQGAVYDGSWSEWGADPTTPKETG